MNSKNESKYTINQPKIYEVIYTIKETHIYTHTVMISPTSICMHNKQTSFVSKVMIYRYLRYFYQKSHNKPLQLLPERTDITVLGKTKPSVLYYGLEHNSMAC